MTLWTPKNIATALWLDAADSGTITESSGAVSQWNDKSGNSRHVLQASSTLRPVVASGILNGRNVIRFDGIDDQLTTATALYTTPSFGIYAVTANRDASGQSMWAGQYSGSGDSGRTLVYQNGIAGISTRAAAVFTASTGISFSATANTQFHLFGYDRNGVNGELFYEAVSRGTASNFPNAISNVPFALGRIIAVDVQFISQLDAAEVICLSAPASTATRQLIEGYLSHKWGLQDNLPSNHPYKWFAPGSRSRGSFSARYAYLPPTPTDYRTVRVKQTEHASLREGLVGAWCPSIEGSGFTLPDLSGNGNNGTLTNMGPEDWVSGQYGRALDFDGSNDTVNVAFNRQPFQQATISLFAFVRNTGRTLWFQVPGLGGLFLSRFTTGKLLAFFDNTTGNNSAADESTATISANQWYHFAATNNGAVTRLYINGIADRSYNDTILQNSSTVIWIGSNTNSGEFANGQMDDIRLYNRALSESEIKLLASRPGIGLRPQRRSMYYAPPTGARRRRILTSMP